MSGASSLKMSEVETTPMGHPCAVTKTIVDGSSQASQMVIPPFRSVSMTVRPKNAQTCCYIMMNRRLRVLDFEDQPCIAMSNSWIAELLILARAGHGNSTIMR